MSNNLHDGHRQRLKERFSKHGLDPFENHQVLELLLCYVIPRKDTNEIAHRLLKEFGSFPAVFEASAHELCRVEGIGPQSAELITFCGQLIKRYQTEKRNTIRSFASIDAVGAYLLPLFVGERNEKAVVMSLNNRWELLGCDVLSTGTLTGTEARTREIVEIALRRKAVGVILAHNHPAGFATPSPQDVETTRKLASNLRLMDVPLLDHLVFSQTEFYSLRKSPHYAPLFSSFNQQ
ncbi:MAG: RadC family protein [Clostridia bacterium]|nr:RadC family protein [Clostridia bacterium]